jgi:hypothetical protein
LFLSAGFIVVGLFAEYRDSAHAIPDQLAGAAGRRRRSVVYGRFAPDRREPSDTLCLVLKGREGVCYIKDDYYHNLNFNNEGEFFGEVAMLAAGSSTTKVSTDERTSPR